MPRKPIERPRGRAAAWRRLSGESSRYTRPPNLRVSGDAVAFEGVVAAKASFAALRGSRGLV